ncbi:LysR family transcriptional regulator [Hyalangium versicolor]|uniref:LysR family transcriptional regulator n=1 Tax=Hyalangium versicolor TaxID=2861190 RepID=UPI001CCCC53C|nr:LysR family transcriptional regulator [Hyalangium versicolor]
MSDRIQELTVFVRVAESGSFSRTARELGLSQPSVSRIVSELEARLGVKLLLRTTRRISVTDAGALLVESARQVLAELEDAEDAVRGIDSLRGTIRLSLPVVFGTRAVIPHLTAFLEAHPLLRVDMNVTDERQNLVADGTDVAIRVGPLDASSFGARKLMTMERYVVATPGYLKRRGVPKTPAELSKHDCIVGPGGSSRAIWTFARGGKTVSIDVEGRIRASSGIGLYSCVVAGMGIALVSSVMGGEELASGALVRLLAGYTLAPAEVHAVFPGGPRPSAKVRALVEHIAARLK